MKILLSKLPFMQKRIMQFTVGERRSLDRSCNYLVEYLRKLFLLTKDGLQHNRYDHTVIPSKPFFTFQDLMAGSGTSKDLLVDRG